MSRRRPEPTSKRLGPRRLGKRRLDQLVEEAVIDAYGESEQRIGLPILDLPLPSPPPAGWEWIETYRLWARPAIPRAERSALPSANCLDLDGVSRARGEWTVAGDERSVESFGKGNVYSVIRTDVVAQLPRTI